MHRRAQKNATDWVLCNFGAAQGMAHLYDFIVPQPQKQLQTVKKQHK